MITTRRRLSDVRLHVGDVGCGYHLIFGYSDLRVEWLEAFHRDPRLWSFSGPLRHLPKEGARAMAVDRSQRVVLTP